MHAHLYAQIRICDHSMVSDGVFLPDSSFQPLPPLDLPQLMLLFRHKLLRKLLRLEKIYPATIEILDRLSTTHTLSGLVLQQK
jgi:hypothetical protein